ncbi:MAG: pyroglutamyl-peptidase I [Hyphomicrobium sp.]
MTPTSADTAPKARRRVLLTGFGPFPSVTDNASARLVAALAPLAQARHPDVAIDSEILRTEWTAAPERLRALLEALDPDIVVGFGVAADTAGFRLETQSLNVCRPSPDALGLTPLHDSVRPDGARSHPCSAPLDAIVARLDALGCPVSLSDNAGAYLCNAAYYHALDHAAANARPMSIAFVHIPTDLENGALTLQAALAGALEIVDVCLEANDHADGEAAT